MPTVIPDKERYPNLKAALDRFANIAYAFRAKHSHLANERTSVFVPFISPWLNPSDPGSDKMLAAQKKSIEVGFDGTEIAAEINAMFEFDQHLRECCGHPFSLAVILDKFYIREAVELIADGATSRLNDLFTVFNNIVYEQGPYTRITYSHIFNFFAPKELIDLGGFRIQRLNTSEVVHILGDSAQGAVQSLMHPPNVGSFFLVQEETGTPKDLYQSFWDCHLKAASILRIIQYHKDGVLYIDYSVPHFRPSWVNGIRKPELFHIGNPRRFPYMNGSRPFTIAQEDVPAILRKLKAYFSPAILKLMEDESSNFRQGSLRAGDYYEASLTYERPTERLIALAIALEALFSPGDSREYSFRISQTAAQLLGENPSEKKAIYEKIRDLYNRRSSLMHGSYNVKSVYEGNFVTHEEIDEWSSFIRRGILRFLTMYLRGKRSANDLTEFRSELLRGALDPASVEKLRHQSDLDVYLDEVDQSSL
jgi:hypothetical protein